jgi:hypothetical protein
LKTTESEGEVFDLNGKPYRIGFLLPSLFQGINNGSRREILRANRESSISFTGELYHYTSLSGFQGIVDTKGFWASDNRYLNDAQEVSHGRDLAAEVLDYKIRRTHFAPFRTVLEIVRDAMHGNSQTGNLIVCFSKARDSLEQWRGYGEDVGVCIRVRGFDETSNPPEIRPMFFGPDQLAFNVKYGMRSKIVTLLSVIRRFSEEYACDRQVMANWWPDDHDEEYAKHLIAQLEYYAVNLKNGAFSEEKEVRLVIPHSYADKYDGGLQFRISKFGLIPYVCTGNRMGMRGILPIKEVIIGPSQNNELVRESVASFMKHRGYKDVEVTLSQVPYRS